VTKIHPLIIVIIIIIIIVRYCQLTNATYNRVGKAQDKQRWQKLIRGLAQHTNNEVAVIQASRLIN